ncbi:mitochondrial enolase superfamily member 1 [Grus japonensis]|uniref:Mitochondrial enolase superfamily member 1 n=1 Tax=Grus japonensis TaxID=30415 RepID=A0ABC9WF32_GRUJA
MKDNKKGFYKYISSKRKTLENVGLLLNGAGDLVTKDMEEVKVLNIFFTLTFAGLNKLEKWADRNLMKFNKGKCKVLPKSAEESSHAPIHASVDQLESSFAEHESPARVNLNQQYALAERMDNSLQGCLRRSTATNSREVRPQLECWVQFSAVQSKKIYG